MGKLSIEHYLSFYYFPEFIEFWEDQTDEYRAQLEEAGKPYGYTGINIFYLLFWIYVIQEDSGITMRFFKRY